MRGVQAVAERWRQRGGVRKWARTRRVDRVRASRVGTVGTRCTWWSAASHSAWSCAAPSSSTTAESIATSRPCAQCTLASPARNPQRKRVRTHARNRTRAPCQEPSERRRAALHRRGAALTDSAECRRQPMLCWCMAARRAGISATCSARRWTCSMPTRCRRCGINSTSRCPPGRATAGSPVPSCP